MSPVCPAGHDSTSTDYCDVCGAPIAAASAPAPAPGPPASPGTPAGGNPPALPAPAASALDLDAPAPAAAPGAAPSTAPTPTTCPNCGADVAAGSLFCEDCGYDFTTGALPPPPADPAQLSPVPPPIVAAGTVEWVAEVWVDPDWYAAQEVDEPCPSAGSPVVVSLRERSVLVGRPSASRGIHPQIDAGSDVGVSRRHCQLTTDGQRWWVEDLQSSNGTFVGSAGEPLPTDPITPGQRRELDGDERLYLGAWTRIVLRTPTPEEAARTSLIVTKLIETGLPLNVVSRHSAREKSIRHGHPSTLHLWWSRKPLAAARAVLLAQLVDDPAARPDRFPTPAEQDAERARLLDLIGRACAWDATADRALMAAVRREVAEACGPSGVTVWDPFAGGGSIPLEGQRLGLPVLAGDLNPVAVLLQRALLEAPRRWRGRQPVLAGPALLAHPDRAGGLGADLRTAGEWVLAEARSRLRHLYPLVRWAGAEHEAAAYLWVRTVPCGVAACGATVPMLSNPWLRRRGEAAWLAASWTGSGLRFAIVHGGSPPVRSQRGAVFACPACGTPTEPDEVKSLARASGLGRALRCVVPDAGRSRGFLVLPEEQVCPPLRESDADDTPDLLLDPLVTNAPTYGVSTLRDLHTPRQRVALTAFAAAVRNSRERLRACALAAGWPPEEADGYARDVVLLLGLVLGRLANRMSTACVWNAHLGLVEQTFIQNNAIALPWDYAEANPLSTASGSWPSQLDWAARVIERCDPAAEARVVQADARAGPAISGGRVVVSTDPPYFDWFVYSSLSDYFYAWLRVALRDAVPDLVSAPRTPRDGEIVPRGPGEQARNGFAQGLAEALAALVAAASPDFPITVYYGYSSTAGPAWEALVGALRSAGLVVTATWPLRTERTEGVKTGRNSVASSMVVVVRPRPASAPSCDVAGLMAALRTRVPPAVAELIESGVLPVDLAQACLGPALAVYTGFAQVRGDDGSPVPARVVLERANEVVDEALDAALGHLSPVIAEPRHPSSVITQFRAIMHDAHDRPELHDHRRRVAHALYRMCCRRGWSRQAAEINALAASWLDA